MTYPGGKHYGQNHLLSGRKILSVSIAQIALCLVVPSNTPLFVRKEADETINSLPMIKFLSHLI